MRARGGAGRARASARTGLALLATALLGLGAAAPAAIAAEPPLTAAGMYQPETVVVIDLTLSPASLEALEADPEGEYVEAAFSLAETDGTPDGIGSFSEPLTVGVRLKGETSFRGLAGKAALKLKFNSFVDGQKFLGLKKMTLDNMVQDPSMVHETLAYEAFREAGVPAPRSGYAEVRLNGADYGLYLNLETPDDVFLKRVFGSFEEPPQHLYEGAFGADLGLLPAESAAEQAGKFEVDEGEEDDRSDLEALIAAVNAAAPPALSERVGGLADLTEMTRMWAVERYIGHWDGYSSRPHNYYLYSDPAGVFQMLPWGADQAWSLARLGFGAPGPALFEDCLADPACLNLYRRGLEEVEATVTGLDPGAAAARLATLLAPWQELETAPRRPFSAAQIAAGVAAVGSFAAGRPAALASWLAGEAPPPGSAPGGSGETPTPASDGGGSEPPSSLGAPTAVPSALSSRLSLNRAQLGRGRLIAWTRAPAPGSLRLIAAAAAGPLRACAATARATVAGPVALRCRLAPAFRRRLAAGRVRLRLRLAFRPDSGTAAMLRRVVRIPRTVPDA